MKTNKDITRKYMSIGPRHSAFEDNAWKLMQLQHFAVLPSQWLKWGDNNTESLEYSISKRLTQTLYSIRKKGIFQVDEITKSKKNPYHVSFRMKQNLHDCFHKAIYEIKLPIINWNNNLKPTSNWTNFSWTQMSKQYTNIYSFSASIANSTKKTQEPTQVANHSIHYLPVFPFILTFQQQFT